MAGVAVITEACLDSMTAACVDVCPVHCIYGYDPSTNQLVAEVTTDSDEVGNRHAADADAAGVFGNAMRYVNLDECTSCGACYQPDVCPVGAIYAEELLPTGGPHRRYNDRDPHVGHDHSFFAAHSRDVFGD